MSEAFFPSSLLTWTALLARTNLPNLHPALVHFPIALVSVAVLFDLATVAARKHSWLDRAAAALYGLAALGAGAAFLAGRRAADSLGLLGPEIVAHVNTHSDWGRYSLWALMVTAVARAGLSLWDVKLKRPLLRAAVLPLGVLATLVVYRTADLGGGLVFAHGVAVRADGGGEARPEGSPDQRSGGAAGHDAEAADAAESPPSTRLVTSRDGGLSWTPLATDAAALGIILVAANGASLDAVRAMSPSAAGAEGLRLAVSGATLLVFGPELAGVQVEATLEPSDFRGTIALAHHVRGVGDSGLFTVAVPSGESTLTTRSAGAQRVLDRKTASLTPGMRLELALSAAGRHLRGLIDGDLVVHGHEPELPAGRVGLLLDGEGEIVIHRITVAPVDAD
jgi:uncharacterized membrane protein